jgi:hemolysin activation/secretion protein
LAITIIAFSSQASFGLTPSQEQNATNQNILNQQYLGRERRDLINRKNIRENRRIRDSLDLENDNELGDKNPKDNGGCAKLNNITITGNEVFKSKFLKKRFLKSFKCVQTSDLRNIKRKLTNYYT